MTASLARTSASAVLLSVALLSLPSAAQPGPAPASQAERQIAITGAAGEPPVVVYGAPNLSVMVAFDSPLKKDAVVTAQGADVRTHPFIPNAIVITPSSFLTDQTPIPVSVPLADGMVVLTLAFSPEKRDTSVRIVRRASTAEPALTGGEARELLSSVARTALDSGACAKAGAAAVPRRVMQAQGTAADLLVCGGGAFAYIRVQAPADCTAETARLTRGAETADVLLVEQTTVQCTPPTCWLVVARAPRGDGFGFELELFARDGVLCKKIAVKLKPSSP